MDVVGSEIGQKMRSAIKAKLTELGCYVDDELPDYVMVMVANKRTRAQMEDDLQLFLGDNTESFVNWLHQVLKKLQEVTIAAPLIQPEREKSKERSKSKEKKSKDKKDRLKKDKTKLEAVKKAKKKSKEKALRKKQEKKLHKSKKKSKHHEPIRPNVPPLLMNMEKESEPSITDVFAGQILKNHGVTIDSPKELEVIELKPVVKEIKRPILPIIDPATITSHSEMNEDAATSKITTSDSSVVRDEQIKEINEIEAKIQGLKQKLVEQLDSMSDDEDFLNIRTEAEELMNDFAEDVFQEISEPPPITPPSQPKEAITPPIKIPEPSKVTQNPEETLPQIELRLPKRPVRERLGLREEQKKTEEKEKRLRKSKSPERFTPEREPQVRVQTKSAKSRLGEPPETKRKSSQSEDSDLETSSKRLTSRVSVLESRGTRCASIVRVRPRPRVAPNSSLLLKAMAEAHKSLLNIPPKLDNEPSKIKRALVHPMRRCVDASNIVIQVQSNTDKPDITSATISLGDDNEEDKLPKTLSDDLENEKRAPAPLKKVITNTDYVPAKRRDRIASCKDDTLIVETINIHNPTIDKDKTTQFIVTMDGFNPNAFLAKKLMTEGLLDEDEVLASPKNKTESVLKIKSADEKSSKENTDPESSSSSPGKQVTTPGIQKKRLSDTSEESDTQVIIKNDNETSKADFEKKRAVELAQVKKRKSDSGELSLEISSERQQCDSSDNRKNIEEVKSLMYEKSDLLKKRKASPIVFDVGKKEETKRERTESASSDNHVTITTTVSAKKYDTLPPLDKAVPQKPAIWCRSFPLCRYGSSCAFAHPRCKFAAACTRRGCVYSHASTASAPPVISSQVVPAANFKTITPKALPSICKFYPNCVNPACHYYHPKLCRYGKNCMNKLECNFYHNDVPVSQYKYPA